MVKLQRNICVSVLLYKLQMLTPRNLTADTTPKHEVGRTHGIEVSFRY